MWWSWSFSGIVPLGSKVKTYYSGLVVMVFLRIVGLATMQSRNQSVGVFRSDSDPRTKMVVLVFVLFCCL